MIKKLILITIFMVTGFSYAQIIIIGVVKDSIAQPLEMANVIAINKGTKKLDSYGFTDAKGNYKLNLKSNSKYDIKVSYIGMKTTGYFIETKEVNFVRDVEMQQDNTLDEVNVTYKMPVTIKGDTIVYNADSFTSGTEKKLGDVLKKLPGVEVNEDGEIEVEGKKVKKVMVEGKDFFDGDSKLATKNIPADAVSKIEVLKNHSEIGQLSRVTDNEDNIVINIKLKEGKKNFWFGEVAAGTGVAMSRSRYIVHPKLFFYSPKYSLNLISDINNIGEIPFTLRDYFKFSGGFKGVGAGGTNLTLSSSDIGFLTLKNNNAKKIETHFGAVNFSYSPKSTWNLSGFGIYSGSETDMEQNSVKNYIDDTTIETTENTIKQKNNLGLFKFSSSYKPNKNNHLDYDFFAKVSDQNKFQNLVSTRKNSTSTEIVPIEEIVRQNPFSINQNLNYYYTLNDNHIFSFEAQHLWQNEDPFYNAKLQQLSFSNLISLTTPSKDNPYNILQNKRIKTNKLDAKLNYYYVINSKSNLNFTGGITSSKQQFNSNIFETLKGNPSKVTNPNTLNNVDYSFSDLYAGIHYKFVTGVFTFTHGATIHNYSTKNTQLNSEIKNRLTKLLPDASVKINLKKSETLRLNYNMAVNFTDINSIAKGYVFNNYNSLYSGNRNLENSLSHNINLSYFSFNMFNYTNVYASINYNKRLDAIKSLTNLEGVNQIESSVNSVFPDETISSNVNFQKSFRKYKVTLGGNLFYSKSNNLFNNPQTTLPENRESKSFTQRYTTKFSSNFKDAPNFDVGYNISINKYDQGDIINTFTTHSPYVNFEVFLLKEFNFGTKYTYNNYRSQYKTINNYSFWDINLIYQKKDSQWEYQLRVTNLLNTNKLNTDDSNSIYNGTSTYTVQPRYGILSVKYNL